ncbi:hypothetical protein B0H13DRAFT_2280716 [Mycena leptocephala]|nr:hypothetical protein B0H13DRAFT_2280716 [Mycena leptocephala]
MSKDSNSKSRTAPNPCRESQRERCYSAGLQLGASFNSIPFLSFPAKPPPPASPVDPRLHRLHTYYACYFADLWILLHNRATTALRRSLQVSIPVSCTLPMPARLRASALSFVRLAGMSTWSCRLPGADGSVAQMSARWLAPGSPVLLLPLPFFRGVLLLSLPRCTPMVSVSCAYLQKNWEALRTRPAFPSSIREARGWLCAYSLWTWLRVWALPPRPHSRGWHWELLLWASPPAFPPLLLSPVLSFLPSYRRGKPSDERTVKRRASWWSGMIGGGFRDEGTVRGEQRTGGLRTVAHPEEDIERRDTRCCSVLHAAIHARVRCVVVVAFPPACVQRRLGAVRARRALITVNAHLLIRGGEDGTTLHSPQSAVGAVPRCTLLTLSPPSLPSLRLSSTPTPLHRPTSIHPPFFRTTSSSHSPLDALFGPERPGGLGSDRGGGCSVVSACLRSGTHEAPWATVHLLCGGSSAAVGQAVCAGGVREGVYRLRETTTYSNAKHWCPVPLSFTGGTHEPCGARGYCGVASPGKDDAAQNKRTRRCKRRSRSLPGMRKAARSLVVSGAIPPGERARGDERGRVELLFVSMVAEPKRGTSSKAHVVGLAGCSAGLLRGSGADPIGETQELAREVTDRGQMRAGACIPGRGTTRSDTTARRPGARACWCLRCETWYAGVFVRGGSCTGRAVPRGRVRHLVLQRHIIRAHRANTFAQIRAFQALRAEPEDSLPLASSSSSPSASATVTSAFSTSHAPSAASASALSASQARAGGDETEGRLNLRGSAFFPRFLKFTFQQSRAEYSQLQQVQI